MISSGNGSPVQLKFPRNSHALASAWRYCLMSSSDHSNRIAQLSKFITSSMCISVNCSENSI